MLEVKHCLKKIPIQSPYENHNSFKGKSFTLHFQAVLKKNEQRTFIYMLVVVQNTVFGMTFS